MASFGGAVMSSPADRQQQTARPRVNKQSGGGLLGNDDAMTQGIGLGAGVGPAPVDDAPEGPPDVNEFTPMDDADVQSALYLMVTDAIQYTDQELSPARAAAASYYLGEPFGNEEAGRSQVVLTELRDTILMIMPSLLDIFFGAEHPVEYAPMRPDQVEVAEQMTDFISDIVIRNDNPGFVCFQNWFQDALQKRIGIVKWWYDDTSDTKTFEASMFQIEQVAQLEQDPTIQILSVGPSPASPPGVPLFDVVYNQVKKDGRIRFTCMPPEEFLFNRNARTVAADHSAPGVALFVGHRTQLTRSQLLAMGVNEQDIDQYAFKDISLDMNQEQIIRQPITAPDTASVGPIATQQALYIEGYPYLDVDGDGIAELRKVCMLGPGYRVISNEPWDERPFAVLCPDPQPHTIIGQGICDYTMDLQKINSMIMRSTLDSLALSIHPRIAYSEGEVSLEDVLNTEIGAPIRVFHGNQPNAVLQGFTHEFVGAEGLQVLAKMEEIKENRIGISKASMGLNADALQSSTKAAVTGTLTSAQQHIKQIARIFAETGVKDLMKGLQKLLISNPNAPRMVRTRGKYVPMNPEAWDTELDVRVNVALGGGLEDEKVATLAAVAQDQKEWLMGGLSNPFVTPKQYRDTMVKILKLKGRMDAETFYQDIPADWQPPPPPQNDPNMVIAQAEVMKAQSQLAKSQADAVLDQAKKVSEDAKKAADIELQREKMYLDDEREREKIEMDAALRIAEINAKYNANVTVGQIMADVKREDMDLRRQERTDLRNDP